MTETNGRTHDQLASDGGEPIRRSPFPTWPHFEDDEIQRAAAVLRSGKVNYWTGPEGRAFEAEFAEACGTRYTVAVANGSVALELALHGLGIGAGDDVIVTPRTFIASASSIVLSGARPVFADVDPSSQNLTAASVRAVLTDKTKALVVVHLAGWPCEMDPILDLARQHGLRIIEDCAQAHGATYRGRPVGSIGDVAAFSFCQDKIISTGGEGGMLVTDDREIWERAWSYKDHGKSHEAVYDREHPPGFRWLHESFGTNWRLTEVQSAIGRLQLRKLGIWVEIRQRNANLLTSYFEQIPGLRTTKPPDTVSHAYYKYFVFVRPEALAKGWNRDRILVAIADEGIPCFSGVCSEIYREKAFQNQGLGPASPLPTARELGETSLMFLVHPTLTESDIEDTCRAVRKVMNAATRQER